MRSATAYFAGAGTVIVAIATGLGGGLLISNIVSPQQEKHGSLDMTRLERRASPEPIQASSKAPEPVPYLAAPQVSAAVGDAPKPQQQQTPASEQPAPQQPVSPTTTQAAVQPQSSSPPAASPPTAKPAAAEAPAAREKAAPEESYAKARDTDVKRDSDVKREARRAEEKRRAERRQQWAERRKPRSRDGDDLRDVERAVREDTEMRQSFAGEPVRMETPRIRLFGED